MDLDREGREYAHWPITGAPDDTLTFEAKFTAPDGTVSAWIPVETVSATEARALIAGPDAAPGTAVYVAQVGQTTVKFRCPDTPEIIIRGGGTINVD